MATEPTGHLIDYITPEDAVGLDEVEFSVDWIRRLCQSKKIKAVKLGAGRTGRWLIFLPSLLSYIKRMDELGTKKHSPN